MSGDDRHFTRWFALPVVAVTALILHGCAASEPGGLLSSGNLPAVTGYQEGNAVMPQGYQVSSGGDNMLRVTATGSASTPNERLLKIAIARAAQYGAEEHKKSFRTSEPAFTVRCGKTSVTERGATRSIAPNDYRVVTLDATFGRSSPVDASERQPKATVTELLADLQAETIPPETQAALVAQLAQACGRTPQ